jgi:ornithine cyclodeaminase/alanine dehydrogenase
MLCAGVAAARIRGVKSIDVLLLSRADVVGLELTTGQVLDAVEAAFREHADGTYEMHPKIGVHPTETHPGNFIHAMPAYLRGLGACGLKWVGGFPRNREQDLPNVTGVQVFNDPDTGVPLAIMDCAFLTGLRTAAVSACIARRCARSGAETLALVGCGFEGAKHLRFLTHALPDLRRIRLYDIRPEAMTALRDEGGKTFGGEIELCERSEDCIRGADVISTCTNGDVQIIEKDWFEPGAFGVGIEGGCAYTAPALHQADKFIVDDIPLVEYFQKISLEHPDEDGEICEEFPGGIPPVHATIGEIISGRKSARDSDDERIVAFPIGLAICDVALAHVVYGLARERGVGQTFRLA